MYINPFDIKTHGYSILPRDFHRKHQIADQSNIFENHELVYACKSFKIFYLIIVLYNLYHSVVNFFFLCKLTTKARSKRHICFYVNYW